MRMMTAAKRFGLYSAFLAWRAMRFKSSRQPRLTVETMFWSCGTMPGSMEAGGASERGVAGAGLGGAPAGLGTGA